MSKAFIKYGGKEMKINRYPTTEHECKTFDFINFIKCESKINRKVSEIENSWREKNKDTITHVKLVIHQLRDVYSVINVSSTDCGNVQIDAKVGNTYVEIEIQDIKQYLYIVVDGYSAERSGDWFEQGIVQRFVSAIYEANETLDKE